MKNSNDTSWDRTSDLPICATAFTHLYILWIKTHRITALVITSQTLNNFKTHDFSNYPFLAYIYVN